MSRFSEEFADVEHEIARMGGGVLSGEGINDLDAVRIKQVPGGIRAFARCDMCGVNNHLDVSYAELLVCSMGKQPQGWRHDPKRGVLLPDLGCPAGGCGRRLRVGFTPDECGRHLSSAVQAGFVSPEQLAQLRNQLFGGGGAAR